MTRVFLALGSNVGDREANIRKAIELMSDQVEGIRVSPLYTSRAVGYETQGNFVNTALVGETSLTPSELLAFVKEIEAKVGRIRRFRWGPREIDVDIVFYGREVHKSQELEIPHPQAHERDFVLRPIADLDADFEHPVLHETIRDLLDTLPESSLAILRPNTS